MARGRLLRLEERMEMACACGVTGREWLVMEKTRGRSRSGFDVGAGADCDDAGAKNHGGEGGGDEEVMHGEVLF